MLLAYRDYRTEFIKERKITANGIDHEKRS